MGKVRLAGLQTFFCTNVHECLLCLASWHINPNVHSVEAWIRHLSLFQYCAFKRYGSSHEWCFLLHYNMEHSKCQEYKQYWKLDVNSNFLSMSYAIFDSLYVCRQCFSNGHNKQQLSCIAAGKCLSETEPLPKPFPMLETWHNKKLLQRLLFLAVCFELASALFSRKRDI